MIAEGVVLRPVEERDLDELRRFDTEPSASAPFEWHGFRDPNVRRRRWEQDHYLGADDALLVVSVDGGAFVGFVVWSWIGPASRPRVAMRIGILLLPEHRGRGIGTAAQRQLVDQLFATTLVHRIEAITEAENVSEQRALERSGFVREGVMRDVGFVRGALRDGVLYSRLRTDPPLTSSDTPLGYGRSVGPEPLAVASPAVAES